MKNSHLKIVHIIRFNSFFVLYLLMSFSLYGQVGINTTDPNAILDIRSSNQATPANNDGILVPKIDNFSVTNPAPIQDGMLVFATGNGIPTKGFYYWDASLTNWALITGSGGGGGGNTLDQAYDQGGIGLGRTIIASAGAVRINGEDGFLVTGSFGSGSTIDSETIGAGTRMFFNPRKAAFRAGNVNGNQWDDTNLGNYSIAFGASTTASATGSSAFGLFTQASGIGSVAFGQNTVASQNYAMAFGLQTTASASSATSFGIGTVASNYASTAFGEYTTASGFTSTAFGLSTTASGDDSTAFGFNSTASGYNATSFGNYTEAIGDFSTAFGNNTNAVGFNTTAFGNESTASGQGAVAFGSYVSATGNNSVAFGASTFAGGGFFGCATAFGNQTIASNIYTTAFGQLTVASGVRATAFGTETEASGGNSTAFGYNTSAIGGSSTAFGAGTNALGSNSTSFGNNTEASGDFSTAFGLQSVASQDYATAFGFQTLASGGASFAFGNGTESSGAVSTAFGTGTEASGAQSTAFGAATIASGDNATAYGILTRAPSYVETAIGAFNSIYTPNSSTNSNSADRVFSIGNGVSEATRGNALTIYKNGLMNINDAYDMPLSDGSANQVLTTNGSGVVSFQNPPNLNGNTLDQAYDEGGIGAGRLIIADNGPVAILSNGGLIVESANNPFMLFVDGINDEVGINTPFPTADLSVNGTANKPGGGSWAIFSDKRLKENISDYSEGLELITNVRPVNFSYNTKMKTLLGESKSLNGRVYQGVIAQELQKIAPDMVSEVTIETERFLEVDPNKFTYALINAVQEQQDEIEMQNSKIKLLESELKQQKEEIEAIRRLLKN